MNIVLHIGVNKTGTSSLQFACSENHEALSASGILYPKIGQGYSAHHGVAFEIHRDEKKNKPGDRWGALDPGWLDCLEEMAIGHDAVVLSSEAFHSLGNPARVAEVFSGHQVSVVMYLREHFGYVRSWYQQAVQGNVVTCALSDFQGVRKASLCSVVDEWVAAFGEKSVYPRVFDRSGLVGGDIVSDFFSIAPLPPVDLSSFAKAEVRKNLSVSGNLLFFKRVANHILTRQEAIDVADELGAMTVLDKSFQGAIAVDESVAGKIRGLYEEDRRLLEDKYGLKFSALKWSPDGNQCPNPDRLARDWELVVSEMERTDKKLLGYIKQRFPDLDLFFKCFS